jgi:hypothetical protein
MARVLNPRILGALVLVMVTVGALGAFALASPGSTDDGVFEVSLGDGSIDVEGPTLAPGRQVIEVSNTGTTEHEIVVVRTNLAPDDLPVGLHGVSLSAAGELVIGEDHITAGHKHRPGMVLGLEPGTNQRYQVDLEPGSYVVFCQTGNHYLAGERTEFEVR